MANRKSSIWKYFIDKCADSVQCSLCNKSYSNKGRGTSLNNHLRSMHKKEYNELNEVIEGEEFKKRNFYTSLICDDIYKSVFCKIKNIIHEIKKNNKFAFTTDVWSDTSAGVSLLSLTLHTINRKFQRINLVLGAIPLEERHTGEYISRKFDEMLNKWDIERTSIHCVMRDSGANMKKHSSSQE